MTTQTDALHSAPELERALAANERYAAQFEQSGLPLPPGRRLAVLACMDARITVEDVRRAVASWMAREESKVA